MNDNAYFVYQPRSGRRLLLLRIELIGQQWVPFYLHTRRDNKSRMRYGWRVWTGTIPKDPGEFLAWLGARRHALLPKNAAMGTIRMALAGSKHTGRLALD